MTFKASRGQLAQRDTLAQELRQKVKILNTAIATFNRDVAQLSQALVEAQADYNQTLELARALTGNVAEAAQQEFDAKSEKWQDGEKGQQVREWIEQWEMSLDHVDLGLPEPLEDIDPEEHARELEDATVGPVELQHARGMT
jgi:chromosome segregation ATPase